MMLKPRNQDHQACQSANTKPRVSQPPKPELQPDGEFVSTDPSIAPRFDSSRLHTSGEVAQSLVKAGFDVEGGENFGKTFRSSGGYTERKFYHFNNLLKTFPSGVPVCHRISSQVSGLEIDAIMTSY